MTRNIFHDKTALNVFIYGAAAFFVAIGAVRALIARPPVLAV